MEYLTEIASIVFLLAMSAYFSASETAYSSMNRTRMKTLAEKGTRGAKLACKLSEHYDKLISTILIGNNIVNIAMASIATLMFCEIYGAELGATVSTAVITVVVLIFGEISPKSIAKDCPERFAIFSGPLLRILVWILSPFNFLFSCWKKLLSKIFRLESDNKMSQEELLMFVDEVEQEGSINEDNGELLRNAIEFSELEAKDILTPRVNLEAVPLNSTKEEIAHRFLETKFSRLLVYENNIDNIIGVIHQKNFYAGTGITGKAIKEIVTPIVFAFANEKVSEIMRKLQKQQAQVAVVLDEFGGTCGIVTMEDVLEELVGDIWDEHDEVVEQFKQVEEDVYQVDGLVSLDDFAEFFELKLDSEMVSLNGWILEHFHSLPQNGDSFEYEHLKITVLATEQRRVSLLEVRKIAERKTDEDDE